MLKKQSIKRRVVISKSNMAELSAFSYNFLRHRQRSCGSGCLALKMENYIEGGCCAVKDDIRNDGAERLILGSF